LVAEGVRRVEPSAVLGEGVSGLPIPPPEAAMPPSEASTMPAYVGHVGTAFGIARPKERLPDRPAPASR